MLPLLLALLAADPPPVVGVWEGAVTVKLVIPLRLVYTVTAGDGGLGGTMRSPDTDEVVAKLGRVTFADGKLEAAVPSNGSTLSAKLSADGQTLTGTWKQGGTGWPVTLKKVDKPTERRRPQTPQPPYPYPTEDLTFVNPIGGHKLAGTLTLPTGNGPFPAVVLVSGSGPQDRDESIMGHKPFRVLADHLTRAGVAVLRYDDRGVAKSGGTFANATSADFATDAHAAVKYLLGRKEIDPKRVGICGHSEGGLIAPLVAADHPADVGFLVLLAGPGLNGVEVGATQLRDMLRAEGKDEKSAAGLAALNRATLGGMVKNWKDPRPVLGAAAGGYAAAGQDRWRPKTPLDPWTWFFMTHDPAPTLAKVRCPVLALNGEKDMQVAAGPNLAAIKKACPRADCRELPGLNHLFQPCKTGSLGEYAEIETTLDPSLLAAVADWVKQR